MFTLLTGNLKVLFRLLFGIDLSRKIAFKKKKSYSVCHVDIIYGV